MATRAGIIKSAITKFEKGSGQLLSVNKCSIMFGDSCQQQKQDDVRRILEIERVDFEDKYLGLPTPEGRMKKGRFQPYKDRLGKRVNNWAEKYSSMGAKEALIKSVAQAIPNHVMGVFKLPAGFHDDYTRIIRNFWWGEDEKKRKVHWEAWDVLTRPKNFGGVGFRDLKLLNQAMLARQCWRIITNPNSLCARLLKSIYYPRGNFLDTVFRQDASPSWRGIEYGLELLKEGLISRIGNGENTNIWRSNWLPRDYNLKPRVGKTKTRIRRVNQLLLHNSNNWNEPLVRKIFYPEDACLILNVKLPDQPCQDFLAWHYERNGKFSVKSAYKLAYNLNNGVRWQAGSSHATDNSRNIWKLIWTTHVPTKVRIFGWRTARDNLATNKNKFRRTLETQGTCTICGMCDESSFHATVSCTKARALREKMREHWNLPPEFRFRQTGENWLLVLLGSCSTKQRAQVLLLLWRAWHLRCDVIHKNGKETIMNSVSFLLN